MPLCSAISHLTDNNRLIADETMFMLQAFATFHYNCNCLAISQVFLIFNHEVTEMGREHRVYIVSFYACVCFFRDLIEVTDRKLTLYNLAISSTTRVKRSYDGVESSDLFLYSTNYYHTRTHTLKVL